MNDWQYRPLGYPSNGMDRSRAIAIRKQTLKGGQRKACPKCLRMIAVACRKCPNCGAAQ